MVMALALATAMPPPPALALALAMAPALAMALAMAMAMGMALALAMAMADMYHWWLRFIPHHPVADATHPGSYLVDGGRFKRIFCRRCRGFHVV